MANALFEAGRNAFAAGTANWATGKGGSGAIQAALIHTSTFTTGIKAGFGCHHRRGCCRCRLHVARFHQR